MTSFATIDSIEVLEKHTCPSMALYEVKFHRGDTHESTKVRGVARVIDLFGLDPFEDYMLRTLRQKGGD